MVASPFSRITIFTVLDPRLTSAERPESLGLQSFSGVTSRYVVRPRGLGVRPSFKLNLKLGLTPQRPKNSGLNLEHAYSHTCWAAYYYLLQIAHLLLQLLEKGSLLRHLAREQGKRTAVELFGSLKNMAQRLLESLRFRHWPDAAFDPTADGSIQIRLDTS